MDEIVSKSGNIVFVTVLNWSKKLHTLHLATDSITDKQQKVLCILAVDNSDCTIFRVAAFPSWKLFYCQYCPNILMSSFLDELASPIPTTSSRRSCEISIDLGNMEHNGQQSMVLYASVM